MKEPTYRWSHPAEWLLERIDQLQYRGSSSDSLDLASIARSLAAEVDSDQIQDLFQNEMDEDGYFEPRD